MAQLSTIMLSYLMDEYCLAISPQDLRKRPSAIFLGCVGRARVHGWRGTPSLSGRAPPMFTHRCRPRILYMMLALWTAVTLVRPVDWAKSKANLAMRSELDLVITFMLSMMPGAT